MGVDIAHCVDPEQPEQSSGTHTGFADTLGRRSAQRQVAARDDTMFLHQFQDFAAAQTDRLSSDNQHISGDPPVGVFTDNGVHDIAALTVWN